MILIWTLCLLTNVYSHDISKAGPSSHHNATALYSIPNNTDPTTSTSQNSSETTKLNMNSEATTWKIEAGYSESKLVQAVNDTVSKEQITLERPENKTEAFKPSPHLADFFDLDSFEVPPTRQSFKYFMPVMRPAYAFKSSNKDDPKSTKQNTITKLLEHKFPYKIEDPIPKAKDWWSNIPEARPTSVSAVKVPAGGLYKLPAAFVDENDGIEDGNSGLEFKDDDKDFMVKKRVNPWKSVLHLLTAFIPAGILISALTPNVVNVDSRIPGTPYPNRLFRRSDDTKSSHPALPFSERCRRRLLCELQAEEHYKRSSKNQSVQLSDSCARHHCASPTALARVISWLLQPHSWMMNKTSTSAT